MKAMLFLFVVFLKFILCNDIKDSIMNRKLKEQTSHPILEYVSINTDWAINKRKNIAATLFLLFLSIMTDIHRETTLDSIPPMRKEVILMPNILKNNTSDRV